jgi:hypothetical protein
MRGIRNDSKLTHLHVGLRPCVDRRAMPTPPNRPDLTQAVSERLRFARRCGQVCAGDFLSWIFGFLGILRLSGRYWPDFGILSGD